RSFVLPDGPSRRLEGPRTGVSPPGHQRTPPAALFPFFSIAGVLTITLILSIMHATTRSVPPFGACGGGRVGVCGVGVAADRGPRREGPAEGRKTDLDASGPGCYADRQGVGMTHGKSDERTGVRDETRAAEAAGR